MLKSLFKLTSEAITASILTGHVIQLCFMHEYIGYCSCDKIQEIKTKS